ncbi:hypothetical protein D9M71_359060 [compost metagenome]
MRTRLAITGACSATCAMLPAAFSGRRHTNQPCISHKAMKLFSAMPGPSFACVNSTSTPIRKSSSPPRTTLNYGACTSPTVPGCGAALKSPPMPRWCWPRRSATRSTRPSATCSCRPSCCHSCRQSSAPADRVRWKKPHPGCVTNWRYMACTWKPFPTRPTGPASSAEDAALRHLQHWIATPCNFPAPQVQCSTRSSRSAAVSHWSLGKQQPSTWSPASRTAVKAVCN